MVADLQRQDLQAYAMTDVEIKSDYPHYRRVLFSALPSHLMVMCSLEVKGLEEGRPSVFVGTITLSAEPVKAMRAKRELGMNVVCIVSSTDDSSVFEGPKSEVQFVFNRTWYRLEERL